MSSEEKDLEPTDIFYASLALIAKQAESPSDILKIWFSLGKRIGIDNIIPHLKVILYENEDQERLIVGVVGAPSEDVVDHLSSESIFSEMICQSSARAIKEMKEKYH